MDKEDEQNFHDDMQEMHREPTDEELDIMFKRILEEERLNSDRKWTYLGKVIITIVVVVAIILMVT
jgi:hypothetical protein